MIGETLPSVIDALLQQAVSDAVEQFSRKLLSVYITGSYANGYAISTSDVDLLFVFKQPLTTDEAKRFQSFRKLCTSYEPLLDVGHSDLPTLLRSGYVGLRDHCRLIWGEPVHLAVSDPPLRDYICKRMHAAYERMLLTRKLPLSHWPMNFPSPDDPYRGYAWRQMNVSGVRVPSLKEAVVLTGWMATAISAWRGKCYVPNKVECVRIFSETVPGEMADALQHIMQLCRTKLKYLLPSCVEDLQELEVVLPKVLAIENFFTATYRDFLIEELTNTPSESPMLQERLNQLYA